MAERGEDASKHDCSICLSTFKIPKILPCFHTFCLQCLDEFVIRHAHDRNFECPLCRACTKIPAGGVKSFQSNFYIFGGNSSEQNADCEVCGEGQEATHYCTDCEENFCERCTTSHMKMKVSREHTLLQLKEFSEKDDNYIRRIQKKHFCPQHKIEEVNMICKDCGIKLCVVCKLTEHENHNTSSITKEAEERRALLLNTIASSKQRHESLKRTGNRANTLATAMEKELETNIDLLEKRVESVIAEVKKNAGIIKLELIENINKTRDYYTEMGRLVQGKLVDSEAVIHYAQNVVAFGDDSQVMNAKLISKLKSLALRDECLIKLPEHLIFQSFSKEIPLDIIGSTVSSRSTVTELDGISHYLLPTTRANTLSMGDAGRLYAAFTNYRKFLACDKTGESASYTKSLYDNDACAGLTIIGSDVYFTSLVDKTVYKLKTPEHVKTKFQMFEDHPHGIAQRPDRDNDKEHELLICCLKSGKLLDMDASEGCVIAVSVADRKQFTWRDKEMPGPTCIATDALDGTVCLGYPAGHKVTLNAPDGTVLSVFSGEGCRDNLKQCCPVSVCFDSRRCIVIADYNNGRVIRIDKFGNFLQRLVQGKNPLSVLFGDDNILYVGFERKSITRYRLMPKYLFKSTFKYCQHNLNI